MANRLRRDNLLLSESMHIFLIEVQGTIPISEIQVAAGYFGEQFDSAGFKGDLFHSHQRMYRTGSQRVGLNR